MRLFNFYQAGHLRRSLHSDFWTFEYAVWLHAAGRAMIAVFVPVLILRLGFPLRTVIWYYFLFNLFDVPFNFAAEKLVMKIGARKTIFLATLVSITYFALLARAPFGDFRLLLLLAFLDAVYDTTYWVAHIYLFLKSSRSRNAGPQTGILQGVRTLASALGPMLGALILLFGTSRELIGASIFFFILSLLPLARMRHTADRPRAETAGFREFFSKPVERRNYAVTALFGMQNAADAVLWPLFIYAIFRTTASVAYIAIAVSLAAAVFSYVTGFIAEHGRAPAMVLGSLLIAGIWLLRLTPAGAPWYYASVTANGFFVLLLAIPLDTSIYGRAREAASLRASTFRNAFSMFGQLLVFALLLVLPNPFQSGFVLAALAMLAAAAVIVRHSRQMKNLSPEALPSLPSPV